jgi:hypothetical protein
LKCPHLICGVIASCKAADRPYVLSISELNEYCNDMKNEKCPLYGGANACEAVPIV